MRRLLLLPFLLAPMSLVACMPPPTPYRYTGLIPAAKPLAWDGRTAKEGTLRIEGTLDQNWIDRNVAPQIHDTALHVPNTTVEGAATLAVNRYIEVGARATYANYDWSDVTANGTMPLPSRPSTWGIGPEIRVAFPFDRRQQWALGLAANFMRYEVPYAEWQLATTPCTPSATCQTDFLSNAQYKLYDERSESHYTLNIAVYPSVNLGPHGEYGHVFGGFSVHTGFKNDGFTDMAQNGSTIQDAGLVFFGGAGYGVKIDIVRLSAMATVPFTGGDSPVNYGFSGFLTAGVDLELWETNDRAPSPNEPTYRRLASE
jgi:hypothetical protein